MKSRQSQALILYQSHRKSLNDLSDCTYIPVHTCTCIGAQETLKQPDKAESERHGGVASHLDAEMNRTAYACMRCKVNVYGISSNSMHMIIGSSTVRFDTL